MLSERGTLKETPTIKLLLTIFEQGLTGILNVQREGIRKILYFKKGSLIWAISNSKYDDLGNVLVARSLVAPKNIERVKKMIDTPENLGKALVEKGLLSLEELIDASREQLKGIVASVLKWQEGDFQFVRENPPERLLSLDLNITDFIRDFILKGLDIGYIRQQLGTLQAEFIKNPDNKKIKKYNLSDKQLELLDCFDGATTLEALLSRYSDANKDSVLKIVYYFLMAEILLEEQLEFLDSAVAEKGKSAGSLEVERTEYGYAQESDTGKSGKEEEAYGIEREIEIQKPAEEEIYEPEERVEIKEEEAGGELYDPKDEMESSDAVEKGVAHEVEKGIISGGVIEEDELDVKFEPEEGVPFVAPGDKEVIYQPGKEIETVKAEEIESALGMESDFGIKTGPGEEEKNEFDKGIAARQEEVEPSMLKSNEQEERERMGHPDEFEQIPDEEFRVSGEPQEVGADFGEVESFISKKIPVEKVPPLIPDKEYIKNREPIRVDEGVIEDRKSFTVGKAGVEDRKKSRLVYLVLLSIAAILIISGSIFLYLNSSKSKVSEDIITPVNVDEKKPRVQKDDKRTEIPMKKEDKAGKQTSRPGDKTSQEITDQRSQKPAGTSTQLGERIYERFDIKSDELKKKLTEKSILDFFRVKLGDPQALKYFKEGHFMEAGKTWNKELRKAGIKFTILLEMDCLKESVINAYLKIDVKEDFYILNRKFGARDCFLVLWGKFYTKQEGGDALKMIPEYFWKQQHPPEVVSLSKYLYNP